MIDRRNLTEFRMFDRACEIGASLWRLSRDRNRPDDRRMAGRTTWGPRRHGSQKTINPEQNRVPNRVAQCITSYTFRWTSTLLRTAAFRCRRYTMVAPAYQT